MRGAQNPVVIFADANLDEATDLTTQATFFNQGQVCTAGSRVLVQESANDAYMEKAIAKAKARSAVAGDPFKKDTAQGAQGRRERKGTCGCSLLLWEAGL